MQLLLHCYTPKSLNVTLLSLMLHCCEVALPCNRSLVAQSHNKKGFDALSVLLRCNLTRRLLLHTERLHCYAFCYIVTH